MRSIIVYTRVLWTLVLRFVSIRIVWLIFGVFYGVYLTHDNLQEKEQIARYHTQKINNVKNRLTDNVYIIRPNDKHRILNCWPEVHAPMYSHDFLELFSGKHDPLNALILSYREPLYIHLSGLERWNEDSVILMGLRGINIGAGQSQVTRYLYDKVYNLTDNTILFTPSSMVNMTNPSSSVNWKSLESDTFRSLCHKKYYNGKFYGASWPAMRDDHSWEYMTNLLGDKGRIFIFSYSNGTIARDDFIRTKGPYPPSLWSISVMDAVDASEEFDNKTEFTWPNKLDRIEGMIDIETNYEGGKAPWNLGKYLKERVANNPKKMYYAAISLDSGVATNHVFIINILDMIGIENDEGVIRYQNAMRNVTIDILSNHKGNPYIWNATNLKTQTVFLPHNNVRYRLHLSHYSILPYAIGQYRLLATQMGILNYKINPLQFSLGQE